MCQDGGLGEGCFEGFKHLGVVRAPGEWGVLVGEVNQRDDNVGEPHNELAIEVGETQECLDCFEVSRGWPDTDSMAVSIEMPVGVAIKPKNSIFCMWNRHFLGLECRSVRHGPNDLPMSQRI